MRSFEGLRATIPLPPLVHERVYMPRMLHEELSHVVIGAFYRVYRQTGYGYLEALYQRSLVIELRRVLWLRPRSVCKFPIEGSQ